MGAPTFAFGGNEHLAEIFDRISDGFVALDLEWRFTYINRAAEQYFGTPRDQMLGKVAWDLFPEGVGPTVAQEYLRAVAGTVPVELEVLSPIKNNWFAHRIYPSGSGATIYFREVSAERGAAEALRESEERFRSLYDHCLDGVLLTTPSGDILAANPAARRILQRSEEELCRLGRAPVVDEEDPRLALLLEQRQRDRSARGEINMIRGDGTKVPVAISSALFTDRHGQHRTSMSIVDLTERKRSEQALKLITDASAALSQSLERDEILRRLTSLIAPRIADVCVVDLWDGERLRRRAIQHRDAEKRTGGQEMSGWPLAGPADVGASRVMQSAASELVATVTDDNEGLQTLGVRSALRVPLRVAGKMTGVVSLFIIDASRSFVGEDLPVVQALADRAALALENARLYEIAGSAKRVRDDMLTMVSHDLRNSLNAIGFIATELARQGGSPLATQIRSAATLADRLLADLGAMVAIESGSLVLGRFTESVDSIMNEVADLFRPLADARAIRLRASSEKQGLTAFVDRHRMVQAVSNVVANAVEISEEGGRVDLAVKQVGDNVELAISDSGPGIAPGDVERMFDRNRWGNDGRRRASVGLGLVISKEYVEAHGGRIRVQSQPGNGSTFTIAIPMRQRGTSADLPPSRRATVPSR